MKFQSISSPDEAFAEEGRKYFLKRQFDRAVVYLDQSIESNPYSFKAHLNKGHCLFARRQFMDALIAYRKAEKIRTYYGLPRFYQALSYLERGMHENTLILLVSIEPNCLQEDEKVENILLKGVPIRRSYDQTIEMCRRIVSADGTFIDRTLQRIRDEIKHRWFSKALNIIGCVEKVYPDHPEVFNLKGQVLSARRQESEAEKCFLKSLQLGPDNPEVLRELGTIYARRQDLAGAAKMFRKVLEIRPQDVFVRHHLEQMEQLVTGSLS